MDEDSEIGLPQKGINQIIKVIKQHLKEKNLVFRKLFQKCASLMSPVT